MQTQMSKIVELKITFGLIRADRPGTHSGASSSTIADRDCM